MPDIPSLTGLRFFAAFSIVINHLLLGFIDRGNGAVVPMLQACGILGMNVFFVLSGFIIHYNYNISISKFTFTSSYEFFVARISRLYPLFLFLLLLEVFASDTILRLGWQGLRAILPYYITMTQSWFFIDVSGVVLAHALPRASITWSISTEMLMYCTYPIILWVVLKDKLNQFWRLFLAAALTLIISFGMRWLFNNPNQVAGIGTSLLGLPAEDNAKATEFWIWLTLLSPYVRIGEFFVGVLTAHVFLQLREVPAGRLESRLVPTAALLSILFILATFLPPDYSLAPVRSINAAFGYIPFLSIIIFCCARFQRAGVARFFAWPPYVRWGEWSYSIYLFHIFLVHGATHAAGPVWLQVIRILGYFVLLLTCSQVLYVFIEMPSRKKMRAFLLRLPALVRPRLQTDPKARGG